MPSLRNAFHETQNTVHRNAITNEGRMNMLEQRMMDLQVELENFWMMVRQLERHLGVPLAGGHVMGGGRHRHRGRGGGRGHLMMGNGAGMNGMGGMGGWDGWNGWDEWDGWDGWNDAGLGWWWG